MNDEQALPEGAIPTPTVDEMLESAKTDPAKAEHVETWKHLIALREAARPLAEFLYKHHDPRCRAIVTPSGVELIEPTHRVKITR